MSKRGPYKTYLSTPDDCEAPRQTKYNRRSLAACNRPLEPNFSDGDLPNFGEVSEDSSSDEDLSLIHVNLQNSSQGDVDIGENDLANGNHFSTIVKEQTVTDEWDEHMRLTDDEEYFADDFFEELDDRELANTSVESTANTLSDDSLLYEGSPITVGASLLLIITFSITHNLTGDALSDLLSLIACHCLSPNLCVTTLSKLKKHFRNLRSPLVSHYYCSFCFGVREKDILHCMECGLTMTKEQAGKSFFIESPVSDQLQTLFASRCCKLIHTGDFTKTRSPQVNTLATIITTSLNTWASKLRAVVNQNSCISLAN